MNRRKDIQAELESISSYVAALPHTLPYSVPGEYFEQFGNSVKEHVVQQWGTTLPYSAPAGYFETFTQEMVSIVAGDDTKLPKTTPYTTPAGYFDTLPKQVLHAVNADRSDKTPARVIPMKQGVLFRHIRWVAAAVVILSIGISAYFTIFNASQITGTEQLLASVPNSEIQEYVQGTYRLDVSRIVSNNDINNMALDNSDIITYLNETGWD